MNRKDYSLVYICLACVIMGITLSQVLENLYIRRAYEMSQTVSQEVYNEAVEWNVV